MSYVTLSQVVVSTTLTIDSQYTSHALVSGLVNQFLEIYNDPNLYLKKCHIQTRHPTSGYIMPKLCDIFKVSYFVA